MATKLIQIVNPNGRKGWVSETSTAAAAYKQPPSVQPGPGVKPASKRRRATKKSTSKSAATAGATKSKED